MPLHHDTFPRRRADDHGDENDPVALAEAAIDLFWEYRDVHGYADAEQAKAQALLDIREGLAASHDLPTRIVEPAENTAGREGWVTPDRATVVGADGSHYDESVAQRDWLDQGFAPEQAIEWLDAGYATPTAASEWTAIGIDTPTIAQEWVDAGFTPQSAALWVEVEDMTPSEAASCANNGMTPTDVERVRRADPAWTRPEPEPGIPAPGWGIDV